MIRPLLCLVAEGVVRDAETNTMSAFNIMEGLSAQEFPVLLPRLAFFVLWQRDAGDPLEYQLRFRAHLDGAELLKQDLRVDFKEKLRDRTIVHIQGVVIQKPGTLTFTADLDGGPSASVAVDITAVASAVPAAEAAPNTNPGA